MSRVLCFGAFDVLHPGHLYYLKESKKQGSELIVVVARDLTIKKIKGNEPKYKEQERLEHLKKVPFIEKAVLGYLDNPYRIIEEIKPDIICLGYDQDSFSKNLQEELNKRNINAKIQRLKPYKEHIYKSSRLKSLS